MADELDEAVEFHERYGAHLKEMRDFFSRSRVDLKQRYGSNSKAVQRFDQLYRAFERFRNELDERACAELPDQLQARKIYYG